jgi:peptide/nickel transport system substrate-binding protein
MPAAGAAAPDCRGLPATIVGSNGPDTIEGTGAADVIVGRGGDDAINGMGGDDVICGGTGGDVINGGSGADVLVGGPGDDEISGGWGRDRVLAGTGADTCFAERRSACETTTKPYGGRVVVGSETEPPSLNMFAPGGANHIVAEIAQAWTCGVREVNGYSLEVQPDVVTALPTVANGGITVNWDGSETIRYNIRTDAVWEDGTPVSGYDFEFTYDTIMDQANPIQKATYEDIIPGSVAAGPKSFRFTLARPTVQAETLFGTILPKHQVEGTDFMNDYDTTPWLSCGPFTFDSWDEGTAITFTRNANYWKTDPETHQQLPYLDSLVFRFIEDGAALTAAFEAGTVQVFNPMPSLDAIAELRGVAGARVEVLPGPAFEQIAFQFGENRLTRNGESMNQYPGFRRAVAHAIDKDRIVGVLLGGEVAPMQSYIEAFSPSLSHGNWSQYEYDPDVARALVAQLCAEHDCGADGKPLVVFTTTSNNETRVRLSRLLGAMLRDAGFAYDAQLEDSAFFFGETLDFGRFDSAEWAWLGGPGLAPLVAFHDIWDPESPPPDGQNYVRWGTPAVSGRQPEGYNQAASSVVNAATARYAEVRDLINSTVDSVELLPYLVEVEQILADELVFVPLYRRLSVGAVRGDLVGGYRHNVSGATDTWNAVLWYRKDA